MQVFVAFNIGDFNAVSGMAVRYYPKGSRVEGDSIFIATDGETTRQVATRIGLGDDPSSNGIVVPVTSYWGRYDRDLWEWLSAKQRADSNG